MEGGREGGRGVAYSGAGSLGASASVLRGGCRPRVCACFPPPSGALCTFGSRGGVPRAACTCSFSSVYVCTAVGRYGLLDGVCPAKRQLCFLPPPRLRDGFCEGPLSAGRPVARLRALSGPRRERQQGCVRGYSDPPFPLPALLDVTHSPSAAGTPAHPNRHAGTHPPPPASTFPTRFVGAHPSVASGEGMAGRGAADHVPRTAPGVTRRQERSVGKSGAAVPPRAADGGGVAGRSGAPAGAGRPGPRGCRAGVASAPPRPPPSTASAAIVCGRLRCGAARAEQKKTKKKRQERRLGLCASTSHERTKRNG